MAMNCPGSTTLHGPGKGSITNPVCSLLLPLFFSLWKNTSLSCALVNNNEENDLAM